jgi:hypothetical protein
VAAGEGVGATHSVVGSAGDVGRRRMACQMGRVGFLCTGDGVQMAAGNSCIPRPQPSSGVFAWQKGGWDGVEAL